MDLIDKRAAIKQILLCENHDMEHDFEFNEGLIASVNAIEELPTIDPVRHGSWGHDFYDDGEGGESWFRFCTECGVEVSEGNAKLWSYCPFCGAYMMGEGRENAKLS